MAMHGLDSLVIGVPNVGETKEYYREFGLGTDEDWLTTGDGGRQLKVVHAPTRRLVEMSVRVDDPEDLDRAERSLAAIDVTSTRRGTSLTAIEPVSGFRVTLTVTGRIQQIVRPPVAYNGPGRIERAGSRAPGIVRIEPVQPRRLGHVVVGSTDHEASMRFFVDGLGFKVSDYIVGQGAFMRCSTDHHNVLVIGTPVNFLHHTAWQVDDIDDVGRGAFSMLEDHPERHVWGLGRHHAGSNFFWYLKDPAGNFSEYYSDLDAIEDDLAWKPEDLEGLQGLYNWGPPVPPSFLAPEDLAALMTGSHSAP